MDHLVHLVIDEICRDPTRLEPLLNPLDRLEETLGPLGRALKLFLAILPYPYCKCPTDWTKSGHPITEGRRR